MKEIPLTRGKVALVDDEDFEWLSKFNWWAYKSKQTFYPCRHVRIAKNRYSTRYMHQFIQDTGKKQTDHIDGNGLNNQKANLRIVTARENCQNLHIKKTSQYPGVTWHKQRARWQAQIRLNGKENYLGLFSDELEAATVYRVANAVLFGAPA